MYSKNPNGQWTDAKYLYPHKGGTRWKYRQCTCGNILKVPPINGNQICRQCWSQTRPDGYVYTKAKDKNYDKYFNLR